MTEKIVSLTQSERSMLYMIFILNLAMALAALVNCTMIGYIVYLLKE